MDIDGTIADARKRFAKAGPEPKGRGKSWGAWLRKVQNSKTLAADIPVPGMVGMCLAFAATDCIVYLTGRSEIYREVTESWLRAHHFPITGLLMRPRRNRMKNGRLKEMLIKQFMCGWPTFNTVVIDDDQNGDIEEMCHRNGYTFLKARSGGGR